MAETTFIVPATDTLSVEVGDAKQEDFFPQVKVKAFDNESNISARLVASEKGSAVKNADNTIVWSGGKQDAKFFPLSPSVDVPEGGYEFNVILKEKPESNCLEFSLETKDVVFYRQSSLKDMIGQEGIVDATETEGFDDKGKVIVRRPENIVNSYAVYRGSPFINIAGGKNYRAGKICHIYRPKAIESGGKETWCGLDIDEGSGKMFITVPQDFLDTAIYPVIVDPTFGYTTIGGSTTSLNAASICHIGSGLVFSPTARSRITKFTIYGSNNGSAGSINFAAYTIVAGLPSARLDNAVNIVLPSVAGWTDSAAVSQVMLIGNTYGVAEGGAGSNLVNFDTGSGNQRSTDNGNLPATWSSTSVSAALYSWYATYETFNEAVV
jgi:hypothetical protein